MKSDCGAFRPERGGCLGKSRNPATPAPGRKNTADSGEDDFSALADGGEGSDDRARD